MNISNMYMSERHILILRMRGQPATNTCLVTEQREQLRARCLSMLGLVYQRPAPLRIIYMYGYMYTGCFRLCGSIFSCAAKGR